MSLRIGYSDKVCAFRLNINYYATMANEWLKDMRKKHSKSEYSDIVGKAILVELASAQTCWQLCAANFQDKEFCEKSDKRMMIMASSSEAVKSDIEGGEQALGEYVDHLNDLLGLTEKFRIQTGEQVDKLWNSVTRIGNVDIKSIKNLCGAGSLGGNAQVEELEFTFTCDLVLLSAFCSWGALGARGRDRVSAYYELFRYVYNDPEEGSLNQQFLSFNGTLPPFRRSIGAAMGGLRQLGVIGEYIKLPPLW